MAIFSEDHSQSRRELLQAIAAVGLSAMAWGIPTRSVGAPSSPTLSSKVNAYIKGLRRAGRVQPDERTSWSVYDFTSSTKLVSINENVPRQAASMIKPFVAQAYFYRHRASPSRFPFSAEVERLMTRMICNSDNRATNELIARTSDKPRSERPKEVERVLRRHAGDVFTQIEIIEYIPPGGRTYRNKASARDYSRFLYAMWKDQLPHSEQMKHLLALPNADRIRPNRDNVPEDTMVLDKTGSTAHLCGNMGIVVAQGRDGAPYPYTMIGILEKRQRPAAYGPWIRDRGNVIREVSDLVYADIRQRHPLG